MPYGTLVVKGLKSANTELHMNEINSNNDIQIMIKGKYLNKD